MIVPSGNAHPLLEEMKNCLRMMELSDAIKPDDHPVIEMVAALRKRIDEVEHLSSIE
jgi:hypothetical protein